MGNNQVDLTAAIEVFLGSLPTLCMLMVWMVRLDRKLARFFVEHEILMAWYCKANDIRPEDLPTRSKSFGQ